MEGRVRVGTTCSASKTYLTIIAFMMVPALTQWSFAAISRFQQSYTVLCILIPDVRSGKKERMAWDSVYTSNETRCEVLQSIKQAIVEENSLENDLLSKTNHSRGIKGASI